MLISTYSHGHLIVYEKFDGGLALRVESKAERVEPRSCQNHNRVILFPEEVIWACVNCLNFPGHYILALKITRLPNPATNAILGAKSLIDERLVIESLSQLLVLDTPINFPLHNF